MHPNNIEKQNKYLSSFMRLWNKTDAYMILSILSMSHFAFNFFMIIRNTQWRFFNNILSILAKLLSYLYHCSVFTAWDPTMYRRTDWFIQDEGGPHTARIVKTWFGDSLTLIISKNGLEIPQIPIQLRSCGPLWNTVYGVAIHRRIPSCEHWTVIQIW